MRKEILQAIKQQPAPGKKAIIPGTKQVPFGDNYKELKEGQGKLAFIDGGNASIMTAPNFCLHYCRAYATVYENCKRVSRDKREGHVLVKLEGEEYKVRWFGIKGQEFSVSTEDDTLRYGKHLVTPETVANQARHLLELRMAKDIATKHGAIVILDGDCQEHATGDKQAWQELKEHKIAGLSKTTRITTDTGQSIIRALNKQGRWGYCPIALAEKLTIGLVKLSKHSKHTFRLDVAGDEKLWQAVAEQLAAYAQDAAFPGYPYPLIEAHTFAKVSRQEAELAKIEILSEDKGELHEMLTAMDAHDILDRL